MYGICTGKQLILATLADSDQLPYRDRRPVKTSVPLASGSMADAPDRRLGAHRRCPRRWATWNTIEQFRATRAAHHTMLRCHGILGILGRSALTLRVGAENSTLASATCCTMCIERYGRGYHSTATACCLLRPSALLCRPRLCFAVLELTVLRFAVAAFARWFGAQFCCGPFAILSSRLSTIASCAAGNTLFCRNSLACSATAALRSADQR